jgi:hypothetical protein
VHYVSSCALYGVVSRLVHVLCAVWCCVLRMSVHARVMCCCAVLCCVLCVVCCVLCVVCCVVCLFQVFVFVCSQFCFAFILLRCCGIEFSLFCVSCVLHLECGAESCLLLGVMRALLCSSSVLYFVLCWSVSSALFFTCFMCWFSTQILCDVSGLLMFGVLDLCTIS